MATQHETTDLSFASALLSRGITLKTLYLQDKRVVFVFEQDISELLILHANDEFLIPSKSFGANQKYLKATISDLYSNQRNSLDIY